MEPLFFLPGRSGPGFETRLVTIAPGETRGFDEAEWRDALVVVQSGEIEVECSAGGRRGFGRGAVLCLTGLRLRALHNRGADPAVVAAVKRRLSDPRR